MTERNAKDFKSITGTKQMVISDGIDGPSQAERVETRMLRSRLDEQSHLICVLKQQADKTLFHSQNLEQVNTKLEAQQADLQSELENEREKCRQLEKRFMDLAANHRELIKFKDDYKRQNTHLVKENMRLREENEKLFSKQLQEKDMTIHRQTKELMEIAEKHLHLEKEYNEKTNEFQEKLKKLINLHQVKEASMQDELHSTQNQLKIAVKTCAELDMKLRQSIEKSSTRGNEAQKKLEALTKEKNELLELSMQRGKFIQDKQIEIQDLERKKMEAENARKDAESRFEREAAAVDRDLRVKELQHALCRAEEECISLKKDFDAYKIHSSNLLEKEKELNGKLRHMII